jgi:two-component system chemotaxis response regulator CheB
MFFSQEEKRIIKKLALSLTGISIDEVKHSVVYQNIETRVRETGNSTLIQYLVCANSSESESDRLLSALTIHTTSWFREASCFDHFRQHIQQLNISGPLKLLSIGCSTGEEVYNFAAVAENYRKLNPDFSWRMTGWDIDPVSIQTARAGRYLLSEKSVSPENLEKLESIWEAGKVGEVAKCIRDLCRFQVVNILSDLPKMEKYDVVSCRNMLIYFSPDQVQSIVDMISGILTDDGLFLSGVSEACAIQSDHFIHKTPGVFKKLKRQEKRTALPRDAKNQNILIVDDEVELGECYLELLTSAGYAATFVSDPAKAIELCKDEYFKLVITDHLMPKLTGLEMGRQIMLSGNAGCIVMLSGVANRELSLQAAEARFSDIMLKPFKDEELLKLAEIHVGLPPLSPESAYELVAVGASTGGVDILMKILKDLPSSMPPVLVVQHISPDFAQSFADRLSAESGLPLGNIAPGAPLKRGHIYLSLGDYHIGVFAGKSLCLEISKSSPVLSNRPSVDFLFKSIASSRVKTLAILLTGMGKDGAEGLLALRKAGSFTMAQNESSCTIFGMPKEAIRLGAARFIAGPPGLRKMMLTRLQNPGGSHVARA